MLQPYQSKKKAVLNLKPKKLLSALLSLLLLAGCGGNTGNKAEQDTPAAELRGGIWISYTEVNSMLSSAEGFKAEFDTAVQNCLSLNIGEIYLHIRSHCDSLCKSALFPQNPLAAGLTYDPLEYALDACRKAGIKLIAWINPYRVSTSSADINTLSADSPARKWLTDESTENDLNVLFSNGIYLNPAEDEVRRLIIDGINELLNTYALDGIHFDDYFYPTTDEEFDRGSYEKYRLKTENPISLGEWRRANVNLLLAGCHAAIKASGRAAAFSVSPIADIDRGFDELYADVGYWVKNGLVDEIIPQIYFGFRYPDKSFAFDTLLSEWTALAEGEDVKLLIGLAPYKLNTESAADRAEWLGGTDIVARQIEKCRENGTIDGYTLFSYSYVFSPEDDYAAQREKISHAAG